MDTRREPKGLCLQSDVKASKSVRGRRSDGNGEAVRDAFDHSLAAEQLLPMVYVELRRLAAQRLAHETPDQMLQPTALVHEAYMRLVIGDDGRRWNGRGHFFGAAAEAMRRILVENARRKGRQKRGGDRKRVSLDQADFAQTAPPGQLLALNEALEQLAADDESAALLVKLRFFAGFSIEQAGETLEISRAAAYRLWSYARAWLHCALRDAGG